jgi:hypothetical protein
MTFGVAFFVFVVVLIALCPLSPQLGTNQKLTAPKPDRQNAKRPAREMRAFLNCGEPTRGSIFKPSLSTHIVIHTRIAR